MKNKKAVTEVMRGLIIALILVLVIIFIIRDTSTDYQEALNQVVKCEIPAGWNGICVDRARHCEEYHPDLKSFLNFGDTNPCDNSDSKCCVLPYSPESKLWYWVTNYDESDEATDDEYPLSKQNNKIYTGKLNEKYASFKIKVGNIYPLFFDKGVLEKVRLVVRPSSYSSCIDAEFKNYTCTLEAMPNDLLQKTNPVLCDIPSSNNSITDLHNGSCKFTFVGVTNESAQAFSKTFYVRVVKGLVPSDD